MPNTIDIRDKAIDVDEVMARIRKSIDEKKQSRIYIEEPWMLQDIRHPDFGGKPPRTADRLAMLRIAGRLDLEGEKITSHRRFAGAFIVSMKRVSRFWIRRYTDAIFFKQNHFNLQVIDILSQINQDVEALRAENAKLRERLAELEPEAADESLEPDGADHFGNGAGA